MTRGHSLFLLTFLSILTLSFARPTLAQEQLGKFEKQLEQLHRDEYLRIDQSIPAERRALVDYGAYITASYLSLDDQNNDNHVLRQYEIVGYGRVNIDNVQEVFIRGHVGYQDFNDQDSFDGHGDEIIDPDFERAYYRFDLRRALEAYQGKESSGDLILQAGRDLVYWGNGLAMSETIDGIIAHVQTPLVDIDAIAGVTPVRTVDFDTSRPNFDHNTRRGFYGMQLSRQFGKQRPFFYALMQRDYNKDDTLDFSSPEIHTRFRYDSYYLGLGSGGALSDRLVYGFEMVYEGGAGLSNSYQVPPGGGGLTGVPQTDDPIHAFAGDIRLDYVFSDEHQTRLSLEAIIATGDQDRLTSTTDTFGGNRPHTGDNAFNAFGFLNTGLAFAPPVSNLMALRLGASTLPLSSIPWFDHLQIGVDTLVFAKTRQAAQIDEPTSTDHRYLGWEPDLFMNWQVTNDVTLALRYGIFFPGDAIQNNDQNRQFFFAGVTYAF
ncbi:MAG TPA: alginate export family protein [Tepidisphaeraceae bacterium]|jgi:hypothetical protein|nr:alginate export family protein [Tepidisphaeraceae bacterium]